MRPKVLLIAHDFPPMNGGGCPRPLSFAKYLPEFGYDVVVLTRGSTCGRSIDHAPLATLPESVEIARIDPDPEGDWPEIVAKRLRWVRPAEGMLGKPPNWLADGLAWRLACGGPDLAPNATWIRPAIRLGRQLIREHRPDAIIATGPPFSSLKAGVVLAEETGLPFVADYRDPWTYAYLWNPRSARHAKSELAWERRVVDRAAHVLAVTPSMVRRMQEDYPSHREKITLLTNGFDDFPPLETARRDAPKLTVRHVGGFCASRQPTPILDAAEMLRDRSPEVAADLQIEFVGPAIPLVGLQIDARRLNRFVTDLGPASLQASKKFMQSADALIVCELVGTNAIPGKCYEYLAAQKPILALVHEDGDATWLLRQVNGCRIVDSREPSVVAKALEDIWRDWKSNSLGVKHDAAWLQRFHRRNLAGDLVAMLDRIVRVDNCARCKPARAPSAVAAQ